MSIPPAIMDIHVDAPERQRPIHLWLPIFLLWPMLLSLGFLALLLTVLVDVGLLVFGQRYHNYTALLVRSFGMLGDTRGMVVRITADKSTVDVTVQ